MRREELEGYVRQNYQDDTVKDATVEHMKEWENESGGRGKNKGGLQSSLSVLMHNRSSCANGKAGGVDAHSSLVLKCLRGRAVQKTKRPCKRISMGLNTEEIGR